MRLSFYDPRAGALRDFAPAAPPAVGLALEPRSGPRARAVADGLRAALVFMGFSPADGREIVIAAADPGCGSAWLKVAPLRGDAPAPAVLAARGFAADDLRFFLLSAHYRRPLEFSWTGLDNARRERAELEGAAHAHAGVAQEPSPRAIAGYLHRFREALARDWARAEALDCVHDALRPGALSPGSRAEFLRRALPALGLSTPASSKSSSRSKFTGF